MHIIVSVDKVRKCPVSLDWSGGDGIWTMSFGDAQHPHTDVEVEFTPTQLKELKKILGEIGNIDKYTREHYGAC